MYNKTRVISSTFGPKPEKVTSDPSKFLRRKPSNELNPPRKQSVKLGRNKSNNKPSVPLNDEKPIMGLKTCKNFIASNAVEAILKSPVRKNQQDDIGFTEKENYGKVPEYLSKVKQEIKREQEIVENCVLNSQQNSPDMSEFEEMDPGLRQSLINQLKLKWDQVNGKYQKICHRVTIDSLGDIKRKEAQEAELQQLEDDIEKLSKPVRLYVRKQ